MSKDKSATELELKRIAEKIKNIEAELKQNGICPSNDINAIEPEGAVTDLAASDTQETAEELVSGIEACTQRIAELDEQIELLQSRYRQVEAAHTLKKKDANYSKIHEIFEFVADEYWMNKNLYLLNRQKLKLQIELGRKEETLAKLQMQ